MQHKSHCPPRSPTAHAGARAAIYTQETKGVLVMMGQQGLALLHAYQIAVRQLSAMLFTDAALLQKCEGNVENCSLVFSPTKFPC